MLIVALRMLFRDGGKFFGIILGVSLASMVITWQGAIFLGLMSRTFALISDMGHPDAWIMEEKVAFIDDTKPMADTALQRVRGVEGVAWAMPFYKGMLRARLEDGSIQNCVVLGIDDATLAGGPPRMVEGSLRDLMRSDGVIVDSESARTRLAKFGPGGERTPLRTGDTLELNDRRAVVVGISQNTRSFQNQPTIYTTYTRAMQFAPRERKMLSFVLVKSREGQDVGELCERISRHTGLAAYGRDQFKWKTVMYFVKNTGIPVNFGIAVGLGFLIGTIITGFMFYSFTLDNLRYFGTLKAMGASDGRLLLMVSVQALVVGAIGYGLGVGMACLMGSAASSTSPLAFRVIWQLLLLAGGAVTVISILAASLSMTRVMRLEPGEVFK